MTLGHDSTLNSAIHRGAVVFAEKVQNKSEGRIIVSVHPNQSLGTDQQMIYSLVNGELDISIPPTAKLSNILPQIQLFDSPFLFANHQQAYDVLDGPLGRGIMDKLQPLGLLCPVAWESGFKHFTSNTPIKNPEDFKGLKVRVMKSPLIMDQFISYGAKPIPIDFHQTRKALRDGVVSAQENPMGSIVNMGFYQEQKYLTLSQHAYLAQLFCFSKKTMDSLTEADRNLIIDVAKELVGFQRKDSQRQEQYFLEKIKASDTQILQLDKTSIARFRNASRHLLDKTIDLLDDDLKTLAKEILIDSSNDDFIIIGLDADLSLGSAPAGFAILRGMELAVDEINQKGGVLGKKLILRALDNQGVAQRGIGNIRVLADNPNVVAVFSGLHSPVALAEVPVITQLGIPFLIPWAAATHIVDNGFEPNWVFRLSINDADVGGFLVSEALKTSGRVGLLLENTGWGRSNEKAIRFALAQHKLEPTSVEWFYWGSQDFTRQLQAFAKTNTALIILVANAPEGIEVVKNMVDFNRRFIVLSHWGDNRQWHSLKNKNTFNRNKLL